MDKYFYKAVSANRVYRSVLIESREGINATPAQLQTLDELVSPLIIQGQSPYMILANHPEIGVCEKTIYNYINSRVLSVSNLDLQRKVKYKLRHIHKPKIKDREIFKERTYKDFQELMAAYPDTNVVEMDTVLGCEGSKKVFLTLLFRSCKCMLIYLLPNKTTAAVKEVFDYLEKQLSSPVFHSLFPVILTDRGTEFSNPYNLETGIHGLPRTCIYYCDPMASRQKSALEKNHKYIRYVLPKGLCFIHPDEVNLTPDLLKM